MSEMQAPYRGFRRPEAARSRKASRLRPEEVSRLLYLRLDGIGDALISNLILERLPEVFPRARITVACDAAAAPLFTACPALGDVLVLDKKALSRREGFAAALQLLRSCGADALFNGVLSPAAPVAELMLELGIPLISTAVDDSNMPARLRDRFEDRVDLLLPVRPGLRMDIERHADMLALLGIAGAQPQARLWLTPEAGAEAVALRRSLGFAAEKTVVLFAAGGLAEKAHTGYGEALAEICAREGFSVVAVGGANDSALNEENLAPLRKKGVATANLCGPGTLLRDAAFLRGCRLAVGADTGMAHAACALGLPLVTLLSGGLFGRFLPYHPATTAVYLPLSCAGCRWNCPYGRPLCMSGIEPESIAGAVEQALAQKPGQARATLYLPHPSSWKAAPGGPQWQSPAEFISVYKRDPQRRLRVILGPADPAGPGGRT